MDSKEIITVKLLIDTKENIVVFAEASKDFVDFLFFLLCLPIGTVIKLLAGKSMAGSIENLYNSFATLNETYLEPELDKSILLNPNPSISVSNIPLLKGGTTSNAHSSETAAKKFYLCSNCRRCVTNNPGANCTICNSQSMTIETVYVADASSNAPADASYVQGAMSYMISDDLSVTPMSMISSISMMSKCNITNISMLEEREVQVGTDKGLELLKASFQSTTVLTDVFLSKDAGGGGKHCKPE